MTEIKLLPHNQDMVTRIEQAMINGNHKIFYTEATGLGKSFIMMYLVYKYFRNKKVLYICPKNHIWYNLNSYKEFELIKDCVTMMSNADFNSIKIKHLGYDIIFIDEAHHLTAPIQGENIRKVADMTLESNPNAFIFGFTATPYVGDKTIGDLYFNTAIIGMDLIEAIESGILQKINYAVAVKVDIHLKVEEKMKTQKFNINTTHNMLINLTDQFPNVNHWLVYFTYINELNANIDYFNQYFPDYKLFVIHSDVDNCENIITQFEKYPGKAILASVSMVLEGIHPKNVEGILLYRNVRSNNTFLQIIGRLGIINPNSNPIFVDIYNTYGDFLKYNMIVKEITSSGESDNKNSCTKLHRGRHRNSYIYMNANTYKFMELSNLVYKMRYIPIEKSYRGFTWTLNVELSIKLGKPKWYVTACIRQGKTYEEIIDQHLDQCIYEYRGYTWTNPYDLSKKLGKSLGYVSAYLRKGYTCEQVIDKVILRNSYEYKGYKWRSYMDLSRQLGKPENYVGKLIYAGYTCEQIIDRVIKENSNVYKGYKWRTYSDLARQLGINSTTVLYYIHKKGYTCEQIIDHFLSK